MKTFTGLFILLFFAQISWAQKQYNNWYFGRGAGLDWNSGSPQAILNNAFITDEGCASISDSGGNLLFYTNGEILYNRNHVSMPNGGGLLGNTSGSQTVLIVPDVEDDSIYYVFTTPATMGVNSSSYSGLAYSIVDMRLDNTSGDVSVKNIQLTDNTTEKLTAVRHRNGIDTWILVHKWNSDEYYAYLLTCTGILGPVVSHAGRIIPDDGSGSYFPAIGCMCVSPLRDKIAATWSTLNSAFKGSSYLDVLDFDNGTGIIKTDTMDLHPSTTTLDIRGYGVCFSPSGKVLYLSENGLDNGAAFSRIMQYNLALPNAMNTEIEIANNFLAYGTLQTGPDNSIYAAKLNGATYLSVIRNPEGLAAACNFVENGVSLGGKVSTWGLPNNWDLYLYKEPYNIFSFTDTLLCNEKFFGLNASYTFPLFDVKYKWDDGSTDPLRYVTEDGEYNVNIFVDCDTIRDTVKIRFDNPLVNIGDDQRVCEDDSLKLDASLEGSHYSWSNGSVDSVIYAKLTGTYMVTVTDSLNCAVQDTINLEFRNCTCRVFVPNTFTANDDGKNDRFSPVSYCDFLSYDFNIYNRWGQNVFKSSDINEQWNGGDNSPTGVYCWTLHYSWFDGRGVKRALKTGTISLLR